MPGKEFIGELKKDYRAKKPLIVRRLAEFRAVYEKGDRAIFEELCYCILTAGSSAKMGARTVEALRDLLHAGSLKELQARAKASHVRFWRVRPSYIIETREYLSESCGMKLKKTLGSISCRDERREFLAKNKRIKGIGYKEASHFLRNIGYSGYAILDKHIMNSLCDLGVIQTRKPPACGTEYLMIEQRMARFAEKLGIDMDHLDLLLWSRKTGEILK
jgi:N-glycosylase/DNA lyase